MINGISLVWKEGRLQRKGLQTHPSQGLAGLKEGLCEQMLSAGQSSSKSHFQIILAKEKDGSSTPGWRGEAQGTRPPLSLLPEGAQEHGQGWHWLRDSPGLGRDSPRACQGQEDPTKLPELRKKLLRD